MKKGRPKGKKKKRKRNTAKTVKKSKVEWIICDYCGKRHRITNGKMSAIAWKHHKISPFPIEWKKGMRIPKGHYR